MKREVVVLFLVLVLIGFVSASFDLGNATHSIDLTYAPGASIVGWVNISLTRDL